MQIAGGASMSWDEVKQLAYQPIRALINHAMLLRKKERDFDIGKIPDARKAKLAPRTFHPNINHRLVNHGPADNPD